MRDAVDLSRYFARIGYHGPVEPTLDVLRQLQVLHPQSIPFENLNPYTGARVALDLESVVDKLIEQRRGGYCFEQNKLFYTVLVQLGFRVTPLIARVRWQRPPEESPPQTHMLLRIDLDSATWFADVGFGSTTLTAPLRYDLNDAQPTPHGMYRVVDAPVEGELEIECETPNGWHPLYRFSLKPVEWIDYEVANWYASSHPDSFFTHDLVVCRILPDARALLFNDTLTLRTTEGAAQTTRLSHVDAWAACLRERFGLDLSGFNAAALHARVVARADAAAAAADRREDGGTT
ncbi:arylamine N-acetyltransferase family protein [Burkholderia mayonis]|uniref:N-hydroxyarylamine O-acetyltransferase n=1 Tax=Burkholderia mayonis TaxID=1385591 RepID=A0A1B4FTN0_9BURK|nr:arylamine N-acetyltransferase [Burkholderia mayonis]AOJ07036.1 N-hydroxyarylamine O-acetyltransferase [Burkholderia mayonis]KVE45918.1 N-hydroxyarylamine O-acetyltransferase [Burkholderia mayonis]